MTEASATINKYDVLSKFKQLTSRNLTDGWWWEMLSRGSFGASLSAEGGMGMCMQGKWDLQFVGFVVR